MSKTWKEQPKTTRTQETPQKAIDRLRDREAKEDIRAAVEARSAA